MRHLKEPNRGEPVKADDVREMVLAIRENNVTAGVGLQEVQTSHGKIISLKQLNNRTGSSASSSSPRIFDLMAASTAGKMKLVRCYFQLSDKFVKCTDEPEFTPAAGNLCAVINTSVEGGAVTAVMDYEYNADTPELFPVTVYVLDAAGGVLCDCRGSQVVTHG